MRFRCPILALIVPVFAMAAQTSCPNEFAEGGDATVSRFIAAPPSRVREAVADAMQAGGVLLFRNFDQSVEGERVQERVKVLDLASGDEAIHARLEPSEQAGTKGTLLRVETTRRQNKSGTPKHVWSTAVVSQTACLVSLLSVDDPLHRQPVPVADPVDARIPDSTSLEVRSRHFFFDADLQRGQLIEFETASPLVVDGKTVAPAGLLVAAYVDQANDIKSFGRAAKAQLSFRYLVMPDGGKVPLRGEANFQGKNAIKKNVAEEAATLGATAASVAFGGSGPLIGAGASGHAFAVPAGTTMSAQVTGDQVVHVTKTDSADSPVTGR